MQKSNNVPFPYHHTGYLAVATQLKSESRIKLAGVIVQQTQYLMTTSHFLAGCPIKAERSAANSCIVDIYTKMKMQFAFLVKFLISNIYHDRLQINLEHSNMKLACSRLFVYGTSRTQIGEMAMFQDLWRPLLGQFMVNSNKTMTPAQERTTLKQFR